MVTQTTATRTLGTREIPSPGRWIIDPVHSQVSFVARHMMISKVRGQFREFSGTIEIAENPVESSVEAVIKAASVDTGDPGRDEHLRSADFLDVERHPEIRFHSSRIRPVDDDRWHLDGELTVRGITRSVTMSVEFCGVARDPWGHARASFLGTTEINRDDFDITWNQTLEAGGFLVGKGVKVEVDVEAVLEES